MKFWGLFISLFISNIICFGQTNEAKSRLFAFLYAHQTDSALKYAPIVLAENQQNNEIKEIYADLIAPQDVHLAIGLYRQINQNNEINLKLARLYAGMSNKDSCFYYLSAYLNSRHELSQSALYGITEFSAYQNTANWRELMSKDYDYPYQKVLFDARFFGKENNNEKALNLLDDYLYKKQQHELLAQRGLILMKQKEYKSAINDFKKAYEAYPINNYLLQLAKCYLLAGNGKKSYDYAVQYLKKENYNFEAIKIASLSGYQSKNYDEALTYAMKFLTYIPNDTLYGLAGDIFMKQQDYISALKNYSLAIKLNPYCTEYYSHRGTIYFTTQNYVVADMDYTLYLDYFPKDGDILYKRGLCRYYSNQTSRACADWKNATKVNQMEAAKMYNKYCK